MQLDGYRQLPACIAIKWNGDAAKSYEVSGETAGALKEEKDGKTSVRYETWKLSVEGWMKYERGCGDDAGPLGSGG